MSKLSRCIVSSALAMTLAATVPAAARSDTEAQSPAETDAPRRIVLVVLAHPDDELVIAPALAGMALRQNAAVQMIYATSGDAGPGVSGLEPGPDLALMRQEESFCATEALGVQSVMHLELGDGTLGNTPRAPDSPARQLTQSLTEEIGRMKPDVIITWGPDGGYGHGDHRMVSAITTQIVQSMGADERPELIYPALIHTPLPEPLKSQGWTTTAPDIANLEFIYTQADLVAANTAAQCHKTQFDDTTRAMIVPGFHDGVWKGAVSFRGAF